MAVLAALTLVSPANALTAPDTTPRDNAQSRDGGQGRSAHAGLGDWRTWTHDVIGTRFQSFDGEISPKTAKSLELKWAFTFPHVKYQTSRSQPAVVDGTVYVGGTAGHFYALDADTGSTQWVFDLSTVSGPVDDERRNLVRDGPSVANGKVYFGDSRGYIYALNADTGELVWATQPNDHPAAQFTSSPITFDGRVYVGVSSKEAGWAADHDYPCCTFRGEVVALDAKTGKVAWHSYTVPAPERAGAWPSGAAKYAPSGGAVWGSPIIDPTSRTLYVGTGQNYTGNAGDIDSVLALDIDTGKTRWKRQMTNPDTWTLACEGKDPEGYCPGMEDGTALDFDFGATPNLFQANGRTLVGIGQKSGVYHTFDARTGEIVWQRQLSAPSDDSGQSGIQWGSSYDGEKLYVATWVARPGTLFALDPATGDVLWETPNPEDGCETGGAAQGRYCWEAFTPAVTSSPGLVYEGSADGKMRIFSSETGDIVWEYDTVRPYDGVNGRPGYGSALAGNGGAVVANGMMYVQSGYYPFYRTDRGYVLLAFGPK